ncbi:MAG: hypothetical protein H6806_11400 [Planctomycetes bacterium]|nr:hypothetical protein [Planctomycetota bacterium]MCB9830348.1 hypothetical protein [Planctomycetota bacterium]MCB9900648.1 hypothetical protein [Planctomycetota bacterium]
MARRPLDLVVLVAALGALLLAWGHAFARTADDPAARLRADGRLPPRRIVLAKDPLGGMSSQAQLPDGVSIDPVTGALVGLALEAEPGVTPLPWEVLRAYEVQPGLVGMPEDIRELDGQQVVMLGFLQPEYDYEDIARFTLVESHWSCCYGVPAGLNGSVYVQLAPKAPRLHLTVQPVRVRGTFRVREQKEGRIVFSVYALEDAQGQILGW